MFFFSKQFEIKQLSKYISENKMLYDTTLQYIKQHYLRIRSVLKTDIEDTIIGSGSKSKDFGSGFLKIS